LIERQPEGWRFSFLGWALHLEGQLLEQTTMSTTELTPPLSFSELAEAIEAAAHWAYTNSFSGTPNTNPRRYFDWTQHTRVGQLVVEISAMHRRPAIQRVGKLVSITNEPYEWDEELNGPPTTRPIWTILCLDGTTMRWEDCLFIPVPSKHDMGVR
jgi:hypothetical protein